MDRSKNQIEGMERDDKRLTKFDPTLNATISVPFDLRAQRVTMHVLSDEKIEQLTSSGSQWPLAMFTLTAGIAAGIIVALYSGGIVPDTRNTFWLGFWVMLLLSIYFGGTAIRESLRTKRIKNAIKEQSKTVVTVPSLEIDSRNVPNA